MKKAITWIIVLAVIAGGVGGFLWFRNRQNQAQNAGLEVIRTVQIDRGDLTINVPASGNVVVAQRTELSFDMPGTVISVNVAVSDRVKAGQVLARLDTENLERAVQQAQIALDQAKINLDMLNEPIREEDVKLAELAIQSALQSLKVARISKTSAEAQGSQSIRFAQEAKDKTEEAYQNYLEFLDKYGLPTAYASGITVAYLEAEGNVGITQVKAEQQIQQAQNQWMSAYQAYQQAEQNLKKLQEGADTDQIRQIELQIEQAQLNLEQAEERLENTVITAPADGVVAAVSIQEGIPAATGLPAITLLDDSAFFVDVTVDEIDIGKVAVDQSVNITLDAYPETPIEGVVESIAAVPSNVGGIIAYRVRVKVADTTGVDIRDGMTASVLIHTDTISDVLIIPNWAIRTDQKTNETYVYRIENAIPVRTTVTIAERNDMQTVVVSGLEAGATVALVAEETSLFDFSGQAGPPPGMMRP